MVTRSCIHCEAEIEVLDDARTTCPICGLDPDLPRLAFDDAPAFFFSRQPRLEPMPIRAEASVR
jgi:hypothetical protein